MKYCTKCGSQMTDDMRFCQKCGTKAEAPIQEIPKQANSQDAPPQHSALTQKPRRILKAISAFCLFGAALMLLMAVAVDSMMFGGALMYGILGIMFLMLSKTPKGSVYLLGKEKGLKKTHFIWLCVFLLFASVILTSANQCVHQYVLSETTPATCTEDGRETYICELCEYKKHETIDAKGHAMDGDRCTVCGHIATEEENSSSKPNASAQKNVVIDVEKYGNISGDELVSLLGEPDEISKGTCSGAFDIPCVRYDYNDADILGAVSFVLVNDQVVRFTSYSEYTYKGKNKVLEQFGVTKGSSCAVAADTNVALRYRSPSEKVDDFWVNLIDGKTFGFLQVTYDMEYYEEWYLPLTSSEQIEYKTNAELTMKSLLASPKSADFPWYDWQYGKNLFYISVSSYVDAQNAFGAEIRNTFSFVYSRLTGEIVLAVVNDEVVANNGYVATEKLVKQLYNETKK